MDVYCIQLFLRTVLLAFQIGVAPVYMAFLHFMGDHNEAKRFSYSKLIWQVIPRIIRDDSHKKVRDSRDRLIQRSQALYFSCGDRKELKLRATRRIWKEE